MKAKWIPALIMLAAGFVTSVVLILNQYNNTEAFTILLVVLIVFYIIGLIVKAIAGKFLIVEVQEEEQEDVEISESEQAAEEEQQADSEQAGNKQNNGE